MTLWTLAIGVALAEDPVFVGTEKPPAEAPAEAPPVETKLGAELGGMWASGNTDAYTLAAGLTGSRKWSANQLRMKVTAANGRATPDTNGDGRVDATERAAGRVETARNVAAEVRYDRFFGEKNSLYGLAGGLHDPFQGYDTRSHVQLGYSRALVKTETASVFAELGADVAREDYLDGVEPNGATIFAARGLVGVTATVNDAVSVTEQVEAYENVLDTEDLRILNDAGVQAKLSDKLALKIGHRMVFDNVPVEGFRKTDQTLTLTLVATLL
jgi:putative salt-induced outer membrane protein YdiY